MISMSRNIVLSVKNLSRVITVKNESKTTVDNISCDFTSEKIYSLIGPSGAGKSSLLRLLNRLDEPTSGEIIFNDKKYDEYTPCQLRCKIGYLFQTPHLFDKTVKDNLLYANNQLNENEMNELLDEVQIARLFLNKEVDNLSVGEKQRIAFARLLATKPQVILLDEPTSALDPSLTESIEQMIKEIVRVEHLTAIVVTHNPEQALRLSEETLLLYNGKLIESGPTDQIINDPQSEIGRKYRTRSLK